MYDILVVENNSHSLLNLIANDGWVSGIYFSDSAPAAGHIFYNHADNSMTFGTNSAAATLAIDASGRVGIGKTDPAVILDVWGRARFDGTNAGVWFAESSVDKSFIGRASGALGFYSVPLGNYAMVLADGGNVGIRYGFFRASRQIACGGATWSCWTASYDGQDRTTVENYAHCNINIVGSYTATSGILFSDNTRAVGIISYNHVADAMTFHTNGAQQMTISYLGGLIVPSVYNVAAPGSPANVYVTSGGQLCRVTSTARNKRNIVEMGDRYGPEFLLTLRPVVFQDRRRIGGDWSDYRDDEKTPRLCGFYSGGYMGGGGDSFCWSG